MYLILAFIVIGMVAGAVAQWVLHRGNTKIDWTEAFVAGLAGSFVFGTLANSFGGNGLNLGISGLIGSTIGAIIVLAVWYPIRDRYFPKPEPKPSTIRPKSKR